MRIPVYQTELWAQRGHYNVDQANFYEKLCESVKPRYCLEIGYCTGRSAACVLYYAESSLQCMVSVDISIMPDGWRMANLLQQRFKAFQIIEKPSQEALGLDFFQNYFPHGLDLVTIDGDHSYSGCTFDLESTFPYLNDCGVIIVDDYRSGPPNGYRIDSVTKSVDDFMLKYESEVQSQIWHCKGKGLCVIRRKSSEGICSLDLNSQG